MLRLALVTTCHDVVGCEQKYTLQANEGVRDKGRKGTRKGKEGRIKEIKRAKKSNQRVKSRSQRGHKN